MAMARNGSAYIAGQMQAGLPVSAAETSIELSYLAQLEAWLALQPDVQYVIHPNTNPQLRDATGATPIRTFVLRL
jgi:porin